MEEFGLYIPKFTADRTIRYMFLQFLRYINNMCLPYLSEQESTKNAGEFLLQVCFTQHILFILRTILIQIRQHASMFVLFDDKVFL